MILKYLLLLAVVVLAFYWWRHNRRSSDTPTTPKATAPKALGPETMVACQHCGVHLPARESTHGHLGVYCNEEHRRLSEGP